MSGLEARWKADWPAALAAWSAHTLLRHPRFLDGSEPDSEGMGVELAAIRLKDSVVLINGAGIERQGLEDLGLPILAHEIGHHVYVPGNLSDHARALAVISKMLAGMPRHLSHLVANLYADLLINDRLERRAGIPVSEIYRRLEQKRRGVASRTWTVYTRAYEHLWRQAPGTLGPRVEDLELDADALLIARVVRSYSGQWLAGARRFAVILQRYLAEDQDQEAGQTFLELGLGDTQGAQGQEIPDGLVDFDPAELDDGEDPIDAELHGQRPRTPTPPNTEPQREGRGHPGRQSRQPYQYRQLLESLGLELDANQVTTRYYKERALPHLIPFPRRRGPKVSEPLAEGWETWSPGDALEALDPLASVLASPRMIPGVTTLQRVYGEAPGHDPAPTPMDLDLYIDCSGSMPNPADEVSYLTLAGTILALSALRAGAQVQATLWAHAGCFQTTAGFSRDERRVLAIVTGYLNGGTTFPLHILRDTYQGRRPDAAPAHVVVISDDGVSTMLQQDELGQEGAQVAREALARARGGGTLVLNLPEQRGPWAPGAELEALGFRIDVVRRWEDLIAFARAFVRRHYQDPS